MKHSKFFLVGVLGSLMITLFAMSSCASKPTIEKDGGVRVTMEFALTDVLDALSGHNNSYKYKEALAVAQKEYEEDKSSDLVGLFFEAYEADGGQLAPLFSSTMRGKIEPDMCNYYVREIIRDEIDEAIYNAICVLLVRLDRLGVSEPNLQKINDIRFVVELPGQWDASRLEKMIQSDGGIEFWDTYNAYEIKDFALQLAAEDPALADSLFSRFNVNNSYGPVVGEASVNDTAYIGCILNSRELKALMPHKLRFAWTAKPVNSYEPYYALIALKSQRGGRPALEGDVIIKAEEQKSRYRDNAEVNIKMNSYGARKWAQITSANIGREIAIVLDGKVYSYPMVMSEITGGSSQISGNFTLEEAKDLAIILNSGKMPCQLRLLQMDYIAPQTEK